MNKAGMLIAAAGALATTAIAVPQAAEAHDGFGPGLAGGLIAGAVVGGLAANAYGPGYGYYGYGPSYYAPAPVYYGGYDGYYGPRYYRVYRHHHYRHW